MSTQRPIRRRGRAAEGARTTGAGLDVFADWRGVGAEGETDIGDQGTDSSGVAACGCSATLLLPFRKLMIFSWSPCCSRTAPG